MLSIAAVFIAAGFVATSVKKPTARFVAVIVRKPAAGTAAGSVIVLPTS